MAYKKDYATKERTDHHQELTNLIIKKLEDHLEYQTPWFTCNEAPFNPVTGTKYKGVNRVSLSARGFDDPRFYTFNNVKTLAEETGQELHVKKGSKGAPVFKALQVTFNPNDKTYEFVKSQDEAVETNRDGEGKITFWTMAYAGTVFNGSQIEGLEPYLVRDRPPFQAHEEAEKVIESMKLKGGVELEFHSEGRAYYNPGTDRVSLPHRELFKDDPSFYTTAMHEFTHATGHASRLNRDMTGKFGSASYAKEELTAELGAYFLCSEVGLSYDPSTHDSHAAYVQSWLKALRNDKSYIFKASQSASKAVDYQLDKRDEYIRDMEQQKASSKVYDDMMSKLGKTTREREQQKTIAFIR
ncbi:ArdC family protein [Burkholderia sp. LMG 13014]|uniref:ArdC family protein n=1 Tax=Burkholderia sp. LMG 13014 TaxID=2709306 RepID=UPI00196471F1|nr:zincin-like metallopeptidase domain-containing protein [Burkholderia sp. LMG 13014]